MQCADTLLTIGIPVYNGDKFLFDVLDSLFNQVIKQPDVEVLICDNASTDKTSEIVSQFSGGRYIRHDINMGYDRNVDSIFMNSRGMYVWILAADDLILPGGVDKIIKLLRSGCVKDVLFVGGSERQGQSRESVSVNNGDDFFRLTGFKNGAVSTNIIRTESWVSVDREPYCTSYWIHFAVVIDLAVNGGIVFFDPLVGEHPQAVAVKKAWSNNGSKIPIGLELLKILSQMRQKDYSDDTCRAAIMVIKGAYPRQLASARSEGLNLSLNMIFKMMSILRMYPTFWLVDLPVLLMPKLFWKFVRRVRL